MEGVSNMLAIGAGFLSFASPCVLPLIPAYLSYITGMSLEGLVERGSRRGTVKVALHAGMFIIGFSLLFTLLGASATWVGQQLLSWKGFLGKVGGVVIIILGLHLLGVIRLGFLQREKRIHLKERPQGLIGSFIIGFSFGAGWTPCIGPILGSILMVAGATQDVARGITLLSLYSLGLAVPFMASALALDRFLLLSKAVKDHSRYVNLASGILVIIFGLLFFTGYWTILAGYLIKALPFLILN